MNSVIESFIIFTISSPHHSKDLCSCLNLGWVLCHLEDLGYLLGLAPMLLRVFTVNKSNKYLPEEKNTKCKLYGITEHLHILLCKIYLLVDVSSYN